MDEENKIFKENQKLQKIIKLEAAKFESCK